MRKIHANANATGAASVLVVAVVVAVAGFLAVVPATIQPGDAQTVPATNVTVATRACLPPHDKYPFCNTSLSIDARVWNLISLLQDEEKPPLLTAREGGGGSPGPPGNISRLGLPEYDWGVNCIHGAQTSCVNVDGDVRCPTSFPNPVNYGATWNTTSFRELGVIIASELRALWRLGATEASKWSGRPHAGLDCWSPNINIARSPLWGRNQEVPSEDPFLNGEFGKLYTQGLQTGEDSRYLKTVVTLKHWDAYSLEDSEGYTRHNFDAKVSNFALMDTYWPAFRKAVVEGSAAGVMCSYNALNGVPTCAHPLLRKVLRDDWKFDGYVTSDTGAIADIYQQHHYVSTGPESAAVAIKNGECDINSGAVYMDGVLEAVQKNLLNMTDVDQALYNTLRLRFRLGLFDPIENQPYWNVPASAVNTSYSRERSLQVAQESMILLQNNGSILPFKPGKTVAVIGPHYNAQSALAGNYLGQLCPDNTENCIPSLLEEIDNANTGGKTIYSQGSDISSGTQKDIDAAVAVAKQADLIILALGIDESVEAESHDRRSIDLPECQHALAAAIVGNVSVPVALVLINGGMVAVAQEKASIPAILEAGYPGFYGAEAIAGTLFGTNSRLGGKLSYTVYPADYIEQIKMTDMELTNGPGRTYRYYKGQPLWPFGHGLSYTTFSVTAQKPSQQSFPTTAANPPAFNVVATIKNTGSVTGDDVVQVYMAPMKLDKHDVLLNKQLVAFERVHLMAGETTTVTFALTSSIFNIVDATSGDLVSTPGTFNLCLSNGLTNTCTECTVTGNEVVVTQFPSV